MSDNLTVFGTDYTGVTGIKAKGTGNGVLTYIRPTGTKSISENGTGIDVAAYSTVDVSVPAQDNALIITVDYNDQTEMWEPNKTYAEIVAAYNAGKAIVFDSIDNAVIVNGMYNEADTVYYHVFNELNVPAIYEDYSYTAQGLDVDYRDEVVSKHFDSPSATYTPTESQQTDTITYDPLYYSGIEQVSVTVGAISSTYVGTGITQRSSTDLTASGATVTVPAGYYAAQASKSVASGTVGTPTASKGAVSNHSISVTPSVTNTTGYITGGTKTGTAVTVSASELVSDTLNITSSGTKDVTNYASVSVPAGSAGTPVITKGTPARGEVTIRASVTNTEGYISGDTLDATLVHVDASELVEGTYSVDSSGTHDVTSYESISVPAGGATASATKGSVSNHSITVTPSVTRTAGWVTAGSSNGTTVTVNASELVSGSQTITDNGTVNVTNLASVTVAIPFVTYYTSSSTPTSSQGSNGDIWLVTS